MRCPGCNGVFRVFVHGNGAVELRPVDDESATESSLPPRSAEHAVPKGTRTIFTSRRRNRPIGGYLAFEKSRSYIGTFAFWTVLGLGSLAACVYFQFIDTATKEMGKRGHNAGNLDIEARRIEHLKKRQDAEKKLQERMKLKNQPAKVQPPGSKVEPGRPARDQAHH